jgi:hypothetical protein
MTYIVTDPHRVNHDGTIYTEGQEIPGLSDAQVTRLLACGVIVKKTKAATSAEK